MPDLQDAILTGLNSWRADAPMDDIPLPPTIRNAFRDQTLIGWKNFMEGLPSKEWQAIQEQHLQENDYPHPNTSSKWMIGLLKKLHYLAWHQWEHRNSVKHKTGKARQKQAEALLNQRIASLLMQGCQRLPSGDRYHFKHNIVSLLNRPLNYKKSWFLNVTTAIQRMERRRAKDDSLDTKSRNDSLLYRWLKTRQF